MPRQANSAHDVRVKKTLPIFVRDLAERLWFEYPKIVHEDIGFGYALYQSGHTRRGREIGGDALHFDFRHVLCEPLSRGADARLTAVMTTAAPASAKPRAIANPMPEVDPVTIARLPVRLMIIDNSVAQNN